MSNHHVEIRLALPVVHLAALGEFLNGLGLGLAEDVKQDAEKPDAKVETKPTATRTRRATTTKAEPVVAEETTPALSYDKDVKPSLIKLASHKNGGSDAAKEIVKKFGVKNAQDIPADKLAEVLELAKAAFEKCEATQPEEDDVSFG